MTTVKRSLILHAALLTVLLNAGCAGTVGSAAPLSATAPPSLADAKRQVSEYVDSGRDEADLAAVA